MRQRANCTDVEDNLDNKSDSTTTKVNEKDKRGLSVMSRRIDTVMKEVIIPMSDKSQKLPAFTTFHFTEHDTLCSLLTGIINRDCPNAMHDKSALMQAMGEAFDSIASV